MLVAKQPDRALTYLKRHQKRWVPGKRTELLTALALAQQGHVGRAGSMLEAAGLDTLYRAYGALPQCPGMMDWLGLSLAEIARKRGRLPQSRPKPAATKPAKSKRSATAAPPLPPVPELPRLEADFTTSIEFANADAIRLAGDLPDPDWFRLRGELVQLGLFQGFDELLCLPLLRGVETHWYQVETVRKVLKQYRGRVLLADEVGLGKTIEAGMVLKEYMLRGMAERVLILTPASLVGQWREEMAEKFGIDCATTHDTLLRDDPAAFWAQPRVIASIAAARRKEHAALLAEQRYDVVVVDEAHHLRDQSSASYQLVNSLQKRFLLLLSATPVQNNLIELYNLLTLLQPGIFKTPEGVPRRLHGARQAARAGQPREAARPDARRDGAQHARAGGAAPAAPPCRHHRAPTPDAERGRLLSATLTAAGARTSAADGQHRLAVQHLLSAAGSSPAAAAAAIARFAERHRAGPALGRAAVALRGAGRGCQAGGPARSAERNPGRKEDGVRASSRQHDASRRACCAGARHAVRDCSTDR